MAWYQRKPGKITLLLLFVVGMAGGVVAYQIGDKSAQPSYKLPLVMLSQADQQRLRQEIVDLTKELRKDSLSSEDRVKRYQELGKKFEALGQGAVAESAYRHGIKTDPSNYSSYLNLGILYEIEGDFERARQQYQLAIDRNPSEWTTWQKLIELYRFKIDDNDRARGAFIEGLIRTNNNENLVRAFAGFLENVGQKTEALEYYRLALKQNPLDKEIQAAIARVSPAQPKAPNKPAVVFPKKPAPVVKKPASPAVKK